MAIIIISIIFKSEVDIVEEAIIKIEQEMVSLLDDRQMKELHNVLVNSLGEFSISKEEKRKIIKKEINYCDIFICAKNVEGCSEKSIKYYKSTIEKMLIKIQKDVKDITTEDLREYLGGYSKKNNCSKVTIDNIRRIISTFFSWLEEENYILKSPARRIHKIRTGRVVKETYSDENIEVMRDKCEEIRDLAIIDLLNSTGMRVGELVKLNISDINFIERECTVLGKGNKQRKAYFDARAKIHLQDYLNTRTDTNEALFVSLLKPHNRLEISGVEIRMRQLGRKLNINKVHPHKFRRTLATKAIDKGMPIEQVQQLLGHSKIDTTLQYAMVNQINVKNSHKKYIG
ncbi:tyrosine-type recombinase/integrase [Clostridium chauvoei]|uniref:Tyrosine-type recombinase/integrase n=1 Tax=Clostridium chauvoei TaxID=46867 RepID=A0ABD4RFQ6_9CLOT|nr:tyrosine-type recombinase/integrase [Clostridium chauvoei]CDG02565.1 Putative Integrase family protein [Clostridium chauvoei JF4335]MBX7282688.1 tyrosine-type recombinase/integrase [Clostridium chauvoei]MBX7285093.1 tyrosine-type recombinase/integrase [Clostridium chauvoei]MBX7287599.1 tyrosine-type recombinase/integrase [Clostridium chauvoei]